MEIQPKGINPKDTTAVQCEECKSEKFEEVTFIRKASRLLTGAATDTYMPIPTLQCKSCGHINKEFMPKF
jgi:hypothetical protein